MFHNLERMTTKPHFQGHPRYRAWTPDGHKWDVRYSASAWYATENQFPYRSLRRRTLKEVSARLEQLPKVERDE